MASIDFPRDPYHGQRFTVEHNQAVYMYDRPRMSWIFKIAEFDESSFAKVTISETQPEFGKFGDIWIDLNYYLYTYNGREWAGITNAGENTKVYIGNQPPVSSKEGLLWFDSNTSDLRVFYNDPGPGTGQWVSLTALNGVLHTTEGENAMMIDALTKTLADLNSRLEELENSGDENLLQLD